MIRYTVFTCGIAAKKRWNVGFGVLKKFKDKKLPSRKTKRSLAPGRKDFRCLP